MAHPGGFFENTNFVRIFCEFSRKEIIRILTDYSETCMGHRERGFHGWWHGAWGMEHGVGGASPTRFFAFYFLLSTIYFSLKSHKSLKSPPCVPASWSSFKDPSFRRGRNYQYYQYYQNCHFLFLRISLSWHGAWRKRIPRIKAASAENWMGHGISRPRIRASSRPRFPLFPKVSEVSKVPKVS